MALNDSLEALKGLVAEAAQAAARVTKNAASVAKANVSILTELDKQKKAYLELGKLYYRDYITGEEPDDAEYLPLCEAITEATKNLEALRGELEEAKSAFTAKAEEPAVDAETEPVEEPNLEKELDELHKELDQLEKDLNKQDREEEKPLDLNADEQAAKTVADAVAGAVFEVVEDTPVPEEPEEPKTEE